MQGSQNFVKQEEGASSAGAAEPAGPRDDGLGERDVYKGLALPRLIDKMMQEHCAFLVSQGEHALQSLL